MEISVSEVECRALGLDAEKKRRIVDLTHEHLGCASVVEIDTTQDPEGVVLRTFSGQITVDSTFTRRVDKQ